MNESVITVWSVKLTIDPFCRCCAGGRTGSHSTITKLSHSISVFLSSKLGEEHIYLTAGITDILKHLISKVSIE